MFYLLDDFIVCDLFMACGQISFGIFVFLLTSKSSLSRLTVNYCKYFLNYILPFLF